jgi:hypothetical protein
VLFTVFCRWLLAHGHTDKAEKILHDIANFNGKPLPSNFKLKSSKTCDTGHGIFGFFSLFKYPHLRMKTLIVYYIWFATSFVYYGLTLNSNDYGASLFATFSIGKGKTSKCKARNILSKPTQNELIS